MTRNPRRPLGRFLLRGLAVVAFAAWLPGHGLVAPARAAPLPVPPASARTAGVGIAIDLDLPSFSRMPQVVFFARLDDRGQFNPLRDLIPSSYVQDGQAYLLNVAPGTYAAVALVYNPDQTDPRSGKPEATPLTPALGLIGDKVFLSDELIRLTRVQVDPGEFEFMGHFVLGQKPLDPAPADDPDGHLLRLKAALGGESAQDEELHLATLLQAEQDDEAEHDFLLKADGQLGRFGWHPIIQLNLDGLGGDDPDPDAPQN